MSIRTADAGPAAGGAAPAGTGSPSHQLRTDIQGLRALAVSLVVVYHLMPSALTGGFVGVDVFFVISGYLITLHLMQHAPSTARDLASFWARRIRRLLPASLLVLASTLVASRLVAPETQWATTAAQVRAATLYVVNWVLARDSVDYLAAENAPSPAQHFWSLSVEEQFYLVWPILILAMVLLARRLLLDRDRVVLIGLAVLVASSLAYSVWETRTNPQAAYFVTPTRMWELGVGGLLGVLGASSAARASSLRLTERARSILGWVGIAMIAWSAATYTGSTPFPGWQAALPVLGTALVLAVRPPTVPSSPGQLLATRPAQWLGDVSYSVYLWHWPLIILVPQALGRDLDWPMRGAILAATLGLAALTKKYVEDPFRTARWGRPLRKPFLLGAAGMAVAIALSLLQGAEVERRADAAESALAAALEERGPCFGARALEDPDGCAPVPYERIVPAPAEAARDKSDAYGAISGGEDCWSYLPRFPDRRCSFGDSDSETRIALVGNSHAGQWLPALQRIAADRGWRIDTYLASQCAAAFTPQRFRTDAGSRACLDWVRRTAEDVARDRPSAVVYTNRISVGAVDSTLEESYPQYADGIEQVLRTWQDAGVPVLVLHDTPAPGESIPDCLAANPDDLTACDGDRDDWIQPEPAKVAVERVADPRVSFVDLNDHICGPTRCTAVTGGVVTYFDGSHLTATYASTLDRPLETPLRRLVDSSAR